MGLCAGLHYDQPCAAIGNCCALPFELAQPCRRKIFADDGKYYAFSVDEYQTPQWAKEAILLPYHGWTASLQVLESPGFPTQDVEDIYGGTHTRGSLSIWISIHELVSEHAVSQSTLSL